MAAVRLWPRVSGKYWQWRMRTLVGVPDKRWRVHESDSAIKPVRHSEQQRGSELPAMGLL
jgi:hypothetical protein